MDINLENIVFTGEDKIQNSTKTIAMNENGVDNLAAETMRVASATSEYFSKIVAIFDETKKYYKGESADKLRTRFYEFQTNFPIVVQNIENYAYSLKKAKANYQNMADVAIQHIKTASVNVQDYIKKEGI